MHTHSIRNTIKKRGIIFYNALYVSLWRLKKKKKTTSFWEESDFKLCVI